MEYNAPATGEKYREIARAMGVEGVDQMSQEEYRKAAVDAVKKLSQDVGIPADLKEIAKREDVPFLANRLRGRLPSGNPGIPAWRRSLRCTAHSCKNRKSIGSGKILSRHNLRTGGLFRRLRYFCFTGIFTLRGIPLSVDQNAP